MNNDKTNLTEIDVLCKAGLTESQAKGYLALVENQSLTPNELAEKIGEGRTNGYMICERLEKIGLAIKKDDKKAAYKPAHPSALEALAEKRRKIVTRDEQKIKQNIAPLIDLFYANNELPGSRTIQGLDGIKEVYRQVLQTKKDVYFLRTRADAELDLDFIHKYRAERAKLNISTYGLTPPSTKAYNYISDNEKNLSHRIPIPEANYSAPVEINVFGDKLALTSYGETQMTTIIDSPPIAESLRQIIKILILHFQQQNSD